MIIQLIVFPKFMAVQTDANVGQQSPELGVFPRPIRSAPHVLHLLSVTKAVHELCLCYFIPVQSFGEHGRELITPEVGLRLLELLGQLGSEMEHSNEAVTPQQKLLQRTVFKVSPHQFKVRCN